MLALPSQAPGLGQRYGLSRAQLVRSAWAIDTTGRYYEGAAAVNRVLAELGGFWRWLSAAYRLPLIRWLEDQAYAWIARNRRWLSALYGTKPECEEPGVVCE